MIWNFGRKIRKIMPCFILIILSTNQLQAGNKEHCEEKIYAENKELCSDNSQIIKRINHDFQTAYSFGNVASISQPPLIITPDINIEAPSNQKNIEKVKKPAKVQHPLPVEVKPNRKERLFNVVKVLDHKGSMHLGRCLKKLTVKTREKHFSDYDKELATLEKLANLLKQEISPVKKLFTQSPSRKDCINYLDFILMAG